MPAVTDADITVARLSEAGDSIDALSMAIEHAAYLDDQPGDPRQKLRGAKAIKFVRKCLHAFFADHATELSQRTVAVQLPGPSSAS